MAIINTILGGTNLVASSYLKAVDLNDTFNAAANVVKGVTTFWLNTYTRSLFDDFSSYTTDDSVPSTKWTYSFTKEGGPEATGTGYFKTRESTNAGGTSKEGELEATATGSAFSPYGGYANAYAETVGLTADKHKFLKVYAINTGQDSSSGYATVSFDGGATAHTIFNMAGAVTSGAYSSYAISTILVIAKGSDEYDCYVAGKLVQTLTDATFTIKFRAYADISDTSATVETKVFITDVYESAGTV
jgi:hypothetical protein